MVNVSFSRTLVYIARMIRFPNSYPFLFCYRGSPDRDGIVSIQMTIFSRFACQYMLCLSFLKSHFYFFYKEKVA